MRAASLLIAVWLLGCVSLTDPSLTLSRPARRELSCVQTTQERAAELAPGRIPEPPSRVLADTRTGAMVCSPRVVPLDAREPRDEAVLIDLTEQVQRVTERALAALPDQRLTWLVDAHLTDDLMSQKVAVAARVDLAERGRQVSDRVPLLAAGDVAVLLQLPPEEKLRIGCVRAHQLESLGGDDVLLDVLLLEGSSATLFGGVCHRGAWRWLP